MVAAAEETVVLVDERDLHVCRARGARVDLLHVTSQITGRGIVFASDVYELRDHLRGQSKVVGSSSKKADGVFVEGMVGGVGAGTDNVIVEIGFDVD